MDCCQDSTTLGLPDGREARPKREMDCCQDSAVPLDSSSRILSSRPDLDFRPESNDRDLLTRIATELIESRDPHLTKETLVLRALKRLSEDTFNLPWSRVLETLRQGQCHFDRQSHSFLNRALELGAHQNDEAVERIASRDYVKKSDVDRLAALLVAGNPSFEKNRPVCLLFAVDGFCEFHDLRLYGNHFRCCEEYKMRHVDAVRKLYTVRRLDARGVFRVVERALAEDGDAPTEPEEIDPAVDYYSRSVGPENVPAIRAWKTKERRQVRENLERARRTAEKKSRVETDDEKKRKRDARRAEEPAKRRKTHRSAESAGKPERRRDEKKTKPLVAESRVVQVSNSSSSSSEASSGEEDEREDVLKTLMKTANDFEERNGN